ncbi:hypothetical protein ACLMJK_003724 [Lecanora helva]
MRCFSAFLFFALFVTRAIALPTELATLSGRDAISVLTWPFPSSLDPTLSIETSPAQPTTPSSDESLSGTTSLSSEFPSPTSFDLTSTIETSPHLPSTTTVDNSFTSTTIPSTILSQSSPESTSYIETSSSQPTSTTLVEHTSDTSTISTLSTLPSSFSKPTSSFKISQAQSTIIITITSSLSSSIEPTSSNETSTAQPTTTPSTTSSYSSSTSSTTSSPAIAPPAPTTPTPLDLPDKNYTTNYPGPIHDRDYHYYLNQWTTTWWRHNLDKVTQTTCLCANITSPKTVASYVHITYYSHFHNKTYAMYTPCGPESGDPEGKEYNECWATATGNNYHGNKHPPEERAMQCAFYDDDGQQLCADWSRAGKRKFTFHGHLRNYDRAGTHSWEEGGGFVQGVCGGVCAQRWGMGVFLGLELESDGGGGSFVKSWFPPKPIPWVV